MYMSHERRAHILRLLAERGSVRSADLARELAVTDETIRTDLVQLEREGQLRRRHGGAEYLPPSPRGAGNARRLDCQLAGQILPLLRPGMRLLVDDTRFTRALVSLLLEPPCVLLTHSPSLLRELSAAALPHRVLCPGGELDKRSGRLLVADEALAALSPDLAILSPERVELRGADVALGYSQTSDATLAQRVLELDIPLALAFPASALAPWSGRSLACHPVLVATEDRLPDGAAPPHLAAVPYLDPASLLPDDSFDY